MYVNNEKVLRIIHHWPCSGGTLISKCIASFSNIIFLNEVHPYAYIRYLDTNEKEYLPTDLIQQLSFKKNGSNANICNSAFVGAISEVNDTICKMNKTLVIRDHSYVDFFRGPLPRKESLIHELFNEKYNLQRIFTIRHPLDSWLSLKENKWDKGIQFNSFNEFCLRIKIMINAMKDVPIFYYEKFCMEPDKEMKAISDKLNLKFNKSFKSNFFRIKLSGDSGRSSSEIKSRTRREADNEFKNNILKCKNYIDVCSILKYKVDYNSSFPYLIT